MSRAVNYMCVVHTSALHVHCTVCSDLTEGLSGLLMDILADNVHEAILCLCDTGILYLSQPLVVALMVCVCLCL